MSAREDEAAERPRQSPSCTYHCHSGLTSSDVDELDMLGSQLVVPKALELVALSILLFIVLLIIPILVHVRVAIGIKRCLSLGSRSRR
jgi:hypothetical protein